MRTIPALFMLLMAVLLLGNVAFANDRFNVVVITDEADAVLNILAKRRSKQPVSDVDWKLLFMSEGYIRLKKREAAMNRAFTDEAFRKFVLTDELLARYDALSSTLKSWKTVNASVAAKRALDYLPASAVIKAKIYPEIKPRDNSFVFDLKEDPAIFLYLDPKVTKEQFDNTLAHELHHVGFGTACPSPDSEKRNRALPDGRRKVLRWIGAFGEGLAMLAAAGGPNNHPHEFSSLEDRQRWDRDMTNFNEDLGKVEAFFLDLIAGRLSEDQEIEKARSFYGIQGPWYTVGWKMAATIETALGRERLISASCDPEQLLTVYNAAAKKRNASSNGRLRLWSKEVVGK